MLWHTLDCRISSNSLHGCNQLTFNGIGNSGDAAAVISVDGNANIGTGSYIANVVNNSLLACGTQTAVAIKCQAYPSASNKVYLDNFTDSTILLENTHSIPITSTVYSKTGVDALIEETLTNTVFVDSARSAHELLVI